MRNQKKITISVLRTPGAVAVFSLLLLLALVIAACGEDDEPAATAAPTAATAATATAMPAPTMAPSCGGHVLHIVQEFPHIIDTCTGRRIHLYEINTAAAGYFQTTVTLTTRCRGNANLTIKTLGNDPGDCGFTDSASSREQIGMV